MLTISRKYKSCPAPATAKTTPAVSPAADRDELAEAISWRAADAMDKVASSVAAAAAAQIAAVTPHACVTHAGLRGGSCGGSRGGSRRAS